MSLMVEKLAYVKKLRHLTSEDISRLSGVPLGTLNKILSGQTKNPAIGPIDRITRVLRVPIRYLLDDELPPECCVTANSQDGVVLLSPRSSACCWRCGGWNPNGGGLLGLCWP